MRPLAGFGLAALLLAAGHVPAAAASCDRLEATLDGVAVRGEVCVDGRTLVETFAGGGKTVRRSVPLEGTGAATARIVDDVPLAPLGIPRTVHLAVAVRGGEVAIERAIALPGAIILK